MPNLFKYGLFSLLLIAIFTTTMADFNVVSFGAKTDGVTDSTKAFLNAWAKACSSVTASTIYVPKGRYLINAIEFRGPCKNRITIKIDGTIVAPDYRKMGNSGYWILFIKVNRVSVFGGTLDAKGSAYWTCKNSGKSCPVGARSITFNWANNIVISGLRSINSQITHLAVNSCKSVNVRNVKLIAPADSPHTDGIHVQSSTGVTITGATLQTGDDCVSIGPGTKNLYMNNLKCGPGHGVSIGSLGKDSNEAGVQNVTLNNAIFAASDNGVRIKSWARASTSFVKNVVFQNIIMRNVKNPIIIDQNYCPNDEGCPNKSSGVKISQVTYKNIQGSSATPEAVTFECSSSTPCTGIKLQDINLKYMNNAAASSCQNTRGTSSGVSKPESCL